MKLRKLLKKLLNYKSETLWHPESPGMKVQVRRNIFHRIFYPKDFATLGEAIAYSDYHNNNCEIHQEMIEY